MSDSTNRDFLMTHIRSLWPMLLIAAISVALDQITKSIVRNFVVSRGTIDVIKGYFEIHYAENTGAAFGMFRGQNSIFIVVNIIAIGFIFLYYRQFRNSMWMKLALGFILGGALGNLIDRVVFQYVTDFIRVRWWLMRWRWWPSFNIADASVCVGAVMLVLGMLFQTGVTEDEAKDPGDLSLNG